MYQDEDRRQPLLNKEQRRAEEPTKRNKIRIIEDNSAESELEKTKIDIP